MLQGKRRFWRIAVVCLTAADISSSLDIVKGIDVDCDIVESRSLSSRTDAFVTSNSPWYSPRWSNWCLTYSLTVYNQLIDSSSALDFEASYSSCDRVNCDNNNEAVGTYSCLIGRCLCCCLFLDYPLRYDRLVFSYWQRFILIQLGLLP